MGKFIFESFMWNILDFNFRNTFLNSEIFYPECIFSFVFRIFFPVFFYFSIIIIILDFLIWNKGSFGNLKNWYGGG